MKFADFWTLQLSSWLRVCWILELTPFWNWKGHATMLRGVGWFGRWLGWNKGLNPVKKLTKEGWRVWSLDWLIFKQFGSIIHKRRLESDLNGYACTDLAHQNNSLNYWLTRHLQNSWLCTWNSIFSLFWSSLSSF